MLICRIDKGEWCLVTNPDFTPPNAEYYASLIILNVAVSYVEYENCGVTYRIIRDGDMGKYEMDK